MTIYLVRHAYADWNPEENRPLSARGRADAVRVADILEAFPITAIYSSPSCRACQTVAPLAARLGLSVHETADLWERRLCDQPVADFFAAVRATWIDPSFAFPGGESNMAAKQRGVAFLQRLMQRYPEAHLVMATHGNLLALLLQHFDSSIGFGFWQSLTMPDVYQLTVKLDGKGTIQRLWKPFTTST